jgi:EAL and modified HD-GYP domain-containing signal transduction protein
VDEPVIKGVEELSKGGFQIALDDYVHRSEFEPLLPFTDVVKLDVTQLERSALEDHVRTLRQNGRKILAEKVETLEEFDYLRALDIDLFQGFFFAKPKVVSGRRIPANKIAILQLLARLNDPQASIEDIETILSRDVSLSVKALKYVNSPLSGLPRKIDSIREAVMFLGRNTIRNWVTLLVMANVDDKPDELMTMGLIRAKLCELMAKSCQKEGPDTFFTVGLFSILDTLMDAPIEEVMENMPITAEMREAIIMHKGDKGKALRIAMDLEFGFEPEDIFNGLTPSMISDLYVEAMHWADMSSGHMVN